MKNKTLYICEIISIVICICVVVFMYNKEIKNFVQISIMNQSSDSSREKGEKIKAEVDYGDNIPVVEEGRGIPTGVYDKFVFVGDSRYRGMMFLAEENDVFICENGRGYDYLWEQMSNIKAECDENTALIIGLGVNDNGYNAEKYVDTLQDMADTMECQIYYMLVNPVDELKEEYSGYHVKNEKIDIFNTTMVEQLDERIGIIDTNSFLKQEGFDTMDGIHYTNDTYEDIYYFIKNEITE